MNEETNTLELLTIDQPIYSRAANSSDYGVWEVVLVSDEIDRYNTKINPRGFVGTPSTTSIYYIHGYDENAVRKFGGVNTGATLSNVRVVKNYATGEFVNGEEVILPEATIGDLTVRKENKLYFRKSDGTVGDGGNMLEAMSSGRTNKVSVGFNPIKGKITENGKETIYNLRSTAMAREFNSKIKQGLQAEYLEWELPELSVLDINSGQANSKTKRIRSMDTTNNTNSTTMSYKKGDEMSRQTKCRVMSDMTEKDGKRLYTVIIDDGEECEMEETEMERMFGKPAAKAEQKPADKEFDEETIKPSKKRSGEENSEIRSIEINLNNLIETEIRSVKESVNALTMKLETLTRSEEQKPDTNDQPKPETNPKPEPSAEEQDEELARKLEENSILGKLLRKNPELLNQIEDEAEKAKYARSLNLQTPKPNPSKEPAAQFENGEVSKGLTAQEIRQINQSKNSIHY